MTDQPWYPQLERVVVTYISHFYVFVSEPAVYVKQEFDDEHLVDNYKRYHAEKLKSVIKPYKWAFDI